MAERAGKQRWAEPGSAHDRLVRLSKVALPAAVGVLIAVLALAPLSQKGDVSFILDKKKADRSAERMRVDAAKYDGTDDKGQHFTISASQAIQHSSDVPIVDITGMFAQLGLAQGPLSIAANHGRYDLDSQKVAISGPVRVVGPDGYKLETHDVTVSMRERKLASAGPVSGQMRLGQFQAGQLQADLGTRTVTLNDGVRLKIVQGAVR